MFIIKKQHIARRFCIADMNGMISIPYNFFEKNTEIESFSIPEEMGFCIHARLTQPYMSLFRDFFYLIHFYSSDSMGLTI